jgi:hypothetical protein
MLHEQAPVNNNNDIIADHVDSIRQIELEGYELDVKKARNALFWVAALVVVWQIFAAFSSYENVESLDVIFTIAMALIFIGLALWTKTKPYTALIVGIITFTAYRLLGIISFGLIYGADGIAKALVSGILITVYIYVRLISPLGKAKELQQAIEEKQFK